MNLIKPSVHIFRFHKNKLMALQITGVYIIVSQLLLLLNEVLFKKLNNYLYLRLFLVQLTVFATAWFIFFFICNNDFRSNSIFNKKEKVIGKNNNSELSVDFFNKKVEPKEIASIINDKYHNIIDLLPDAIHIKYKGRLIYSNEAGVKLLGFNKAEEFLGRYDDEFTHPDYQKMSRIRGDNIRLMGKNAPLIESKVVRVDGEIVDIEVASTGIDFNGETAILSVIRNITERKKAEQAICKISKENKELLEKTLEIDKLKTEFFSNISHEFKTPLNVILGAVQLMDVNLSTNEINKEKLFYKKYVNVMKQNCYRLLRLINNLIDITEIDSNFLELNFRNYNIISIVEDITLTAADYAKNKGINIIFDTEVEEKVIACDADKIERIMLNLISNAIKYSRDNGKIYVSIFDKNESVIISVKDNGIGIPKDKIDEIFDRFKKVDASLNRKCEGSGIGLSLVKSLVEKHKGKIWAESILGNGTEFFVQLPAKLLQEQEYEKGTSYSSNSLVEKINIEFSDIYKLY